MAQLFLSPVAPVVQPMHARLGADHTAGVGCGGRPCIVGGEERAERVSHTCVLGFKDEDEHGAYKETMMRHLPDSRHPRSAESAEEPSGAGFGAGCGEGVLVDGVDSQAAQRAHMRALTMERQAAEGRIKRPLNLHGNSDPEARREAARLRVIEVRAELARIEAKHQIWLQARTEPLS